MSMLVTAVVKDPIAIPARISVANFVFDDVLDILYAIATAPVPPMNAAIGRTLKLPITVGTFVRNTNVAPNEAPEATPIKYGSARGLRNNPWYVAPATERDAPTNSASSILGNLISHRIVYDESSQVLSTLMNGNLDNVIIIVSIGCIDTDPIDAAKTQHTKDTKIHIMILLHGNNDL